MTAQVSSSVYTSQVCSYWGDELQGLHRQKFQQLPKYCTWTIFKDYPGLKNVI